MQTYQGFTPIKSFVEKGLRKYIRKWLNGEINKELVLFIDGSNVVNRITSAIEKYGYARPQVDEGNDLFIYNAFGVNITPTRYFFRRLFELMEGWGYPQLVVFFDFYGKDITIEKVFSEYKKHRNVKDKVFKVNRYYEFEKWEITPNLAKFGINDISNLSSVANNELEFLELVQKIQNDFIAYSQKLYEFLRTDKLILLQIIKRQLGVNDNKTAEIIYRKMLSRVDAQLNKLIICEILKLTPIKCFMVKNVEADFILAYALHIFNATIGKWLGIRPTIVSNDTDYYQLWNVNQYVEKELVHFGSRLKLGVQPPTAGHRILDLLNLDHKYFTTGEEGKNLRKLEKQKVITKQQRLELQRYGIYRYFKEFYGVEIGYTPNHHLIGEYKNRIDKVIEQQRKWIENLNWNVEKFAQYGVNLITTIKTLYGDRTDYIKGIRGVGGKSLLKLFGYQKLTDRELQEIYLVKDEDLERLILEQIKELEKELGLTELGVSLSPTTTNHIINHLTVIVNSLTVITSNSKSQTKLNPNELDKELIWTLLVNFYTIDLSSKALLETKVGGGSLETIKEIWLRLGIPPTIIKLFPNAKLNNFLIDLINEYNQLVKNNKVGRIQFQPFQPLGKPPTANTLNGLFDLLNITTSAFL